MVAEASLGDSKAAERRLEKLKKLSLLQVPPPVNTLAKELAKAIALPSRALADAAHVAITAVHGIEYLLTWNCTHLANPALTHKIMKVCEEAGFAAPQIVTPEMLREAS